VNFNHSGIINNDTTLCQGGSMTVNSFLPSTNEIIEQNNFETGSTGWNRVDRFSFNGTTILGPFSNETVSFTKSLSNFNDSITIDFDFFPFDSWDFNEPFQFYVNGNLISTSYFGMNNGSSSDNRFNNIGSIPRRCWGGGATFFAFHGKFKIPIFSSSINFSISQGSSQDICDESWGIDNLTITGKKPIICQWSTGDTTTAITLNPTQSQRVFLTTNNGTTTCTDSLNVTVQNKPSYNLTDTVSLCASSTVLDAGSGYQQYQWSGGSTAQNLTVNQSGVYTATVVQGACILSDSILVSLNNASIVTPDTTLCSGQELRVLTQNISKSEVVYENNFETDANGWNVSNRFGFNGSTILGKFSNNSIELNINNSKYYDSAQIEFDIFPHDSWDGDEPFLIYLNNNLIFDVRFALSPGQNQCNNPNFTRLIPIPQTGSCWGPGGVTVYSFKGKFTIPIFGPINQFQINQSNGQQLCDESWSIDNLKITGIGGSGNKSARWSTGDTTASLLVQPLASTTYQLTTSNGITTCVDSIRVSVETPKVQLGLSQGTTLCSGDSLVFTATGGTRPLQFMWKQNGTTVDSGLNLSRFRADSSGMYSLITRSPFGCSDTSGNTSITVVQRPGALLTATSSTVGNASPVTLVATPTYPNNVLQYLWKRGNDTLPASNVVPNQSSISTTKAGSYVVYITNDGCTDTSNAVVLTANQGGTGSTPIPQLGPAAFHYQAALYNFMGLPLSGKQVRLQFSIADSIQGNPLYREIQSVQTDQRGMVHTSIGNGQALIGNMNNLDWAVPTPRVLVVDVDTLGNGAFVRMGASSLMSVPYAQYARTSGDGRRSVYGIIDHQAQIVQGKGFTISNLGNDIILIHFDEPFQETPQFWISASDGGGIGFYKVMDRQNVQVSCSFVTGSQIQFEAKGK
jgi:hypothetical protein